jgi:hypothetical protein
MLDGPAAVETGVEVAEGVELAGAAASGTATSEDGGTVDGVVIGDSGTGNLPDFLTSRVGEAAAPSEAGRASAREACTVGMVTMTPETSATVMAAAANPRFVQIAAMARSRFVALSARWACIDHLSAGDVNC